MKAESVRPGGIKTKFFMGKQTRITQNRPTSTNRKCWNSSRHWLQVIICMGVKKRSWQLRVMEENNLKTRRSELWSRGHLCVMQFLENLSQHWSTSGSCGLWNQSRPARPHNIQPQAHKSPPFCKIPSKRHLPPPPLAAFHTQKNNNQFTNRFSLLYHFHSRAKRKGKKAFPFPHWHFVKHTTHTCWGQAWIRIVCDLAGSHS